MAGASMDGGRRGPRAIAARARLVLAPLVLVLLASLLASALAKPHGENVHRTDGDCRACHTADAATLNADKAAAAAALAPDLEARCFACHSDEGPSHRTGIRPMKSVPPTLPLAANGTIGCATCHFLHGENTAFGDLLRLDNRRGGLCLSCHQLSELQ
jgi:predicted CXXCH cytochrome family protein